MSGDYPVWRCVLRSLECLGVHQPGYVLVLATVEEIRRVGVALQSSTRLHNFGIIVSLYSGTYWTARWFVILLHLCLMMVAHVKQTLPAILHSTCV